MQTSVADLAKEPDITPEAIQLHAMDLDYEIGDDDIVPRELSSKIRNINLGT